MEVLLQPWVYIYGAQKNCLIETVHFSTYNICYSWKHLKCIYRFFFVFQRYKLYRGIIRFLESVWTFTKIVNMVAIIATMVLYFGCPKEPSHWYGTFESDTFLYFKNISLIYSGIIYYGERSLLLSGSYSGCIYRFHFCVSNIKALHRYHFLWRKKSVVAW